MRSPRRSLALLATAILVGSAPLRAEPPTLTTSARTNEALLSRLPKFDATKSDAAKKAAAEDAARKAAVEASGRTEAKEVDGVVYLPDFKVADKKVFAPRDDEWLTPKGLDEVAVRQMEARMNTLDLILNRWHIPLLTPSFKQRARADYEAERNAAENERLQHVIDVSNGKK